MSWIRSEGFELRPILVIEDHLEPLTKIIEILAAEAAHFLGLLTVVSLPREPRGDSRESVRGWLESHPQLQVAAYLAERDAADLGAAFPDRFQPVPAAALESQTSDRLRAILAGMLRPGGLLLQDICLDSLAFIPHGDLVESFTKIAHSVQQGFPARRRPECWLMSEQRRFEADFMPRLARQGFLPKNFLSKKTLDRNLSQNLKAFLVESMPLFLRLAQHGEESLETILGHEDRDEVMSECDLVLWQPGGRIRIGGRLVKPEEAGRLRQPGTKISQFWDALVRDLFGRHAGVTIEKLNEIRGDDRGSSLAYDVRQMFAVADGSSILQKVNKSYRFDDRYRVAWVTESPFL